MATECSGRPWGGELMEELDFQKLYESAGPVLVDDLDYNYDDLAHAGIIGMRWGKRRYQNDDGTYTELGKERRRKYGGMSRAEKKAAKKAKKKADEAREAKKERTDAVKRGDIRYAQVNFDKFSEDEITELYRRYDMKREIDRINTQKSQETLDKWVSRFNSAGKMAVSIDTIYNSLNDISEKSKDNKAAEKRRKNEAKKAKLLLDEQQLRNEKAKAELDRYKEEPSEYRKKMRDLALQKEEANIAQTKANTEKTLAEANKNKLKEILVADPVLERKYLQEREQILKDKREEFEKRGFTKSAIEANMEIEKRKRPDNLVDYLNAGGGTELLSTLVKAEKGKFDPEEVGEKAATSILKKLKDGKIEL